MSIWLCPCFALLRPAAVLLKDISLGLVNIPQGRCKAVNPAPKSLAAAPFLRRTKLADKADCRCYLRMCTPFQPV